MALAQRLALDEIASERRAASADSVGGEGSGTAPPDRAAEEAAEAAGRRLNTAANAANRRLAAG